MNQLTITRNLLLTAVCVFGALHAHAQTRSFEIETDPVNFFSNGYNFNFGYSMPHWAVRLVSYKTELPEALHGNDDFVQNMIGFAVDVDYYIKENNNGLFLGPVILYSRDELISPQGIKQNNDQFSLGARVGYRIMPFRAQRDQLQGFYFTPFFSPFYTIADDKEFADGTRFAYKQVQWWGGIHLGWRINVDNK